KNHNLGFTIPYTLGGEERQYLPDFIVRLQSNTRLRLAEGEEPQPLDYLIIEVSGQQKKDKQAKTATARSLWVPAINNHGGFGRWGFVEVTDPWETQGTL